VPEGNSDLVRNALALSSDALMKFHFYQIRKGDTLYDLARHYGVSVAMIQDYNKGLNPSALAIGQRILVPALKNVPVYPGKKSDSSPAAAVIESPENFRGSYIVQRGDTLWSIARRFGTDPYNVAYHNGLHLESILSIGTQLRVPEKDS
jgi:membrane-bound lytic murein transglycosylase D